jgi:hypothetical protein
MEEKMAKKKKELTWHKLVKMSKYGKKIPESREAKRLRKRLSR